jgi:hypothetical protein
MPASTDFHVTGPVVISWAIVGGNYAELGRTDNEDLVRISVTDHKRMFSRNDQGDMIGEIVLSGSTATVDFTMVSWNQTEIEKLIERARVGTSTGGIAKEGLFATIGGTVVGGAAPKTIKLKIEPTTSGETVYEFALVHLASGPEYMDFGNTLKRIALSFATLAPASGTTTIITTSTKT